MASKDKTLLPVGHPTTVPGITELQGERWRSTKRRGRTEMRGMKKRVEQNKNLCCHQFICGVMKNSEHLPCDSISNLPIVNDIFSSKAILLQICNN